MLKSLEEEWLETTLGQYLLGYEQQKYDAATGDMFGFYALQVGSPQIQLLKNSRIPNIFYANVHNGDLKCESDYLPFAENCIDLLCLPHALEFSDNPHQTLREAARVLVPEGYLVITGYNPFSFWGVKNLFNRKENYPWSGQFFSISRIKDWLALLSLEFVDAQFCCYAPPLRDEKWLAYFSFMEKFGSKWWPRMGGLYFIVAKKRVVNMKLLKPQWKQSRLSSRLVMSNHKKTKLSQKAKENINE